MALFDYDPIQLKLLLKNNIRLDFRSTASLPQYRSTKKSRIPPIYFVLMQDFTISLILSSMLIMTQTNYWLFSLMNLSISMFMIALTLVVEFHDIILHPGDVEILAHRPISGGTYFLSKFLNLLFYVSLLSLAFGVPASLLGIFAEGSSAFFAPLYLIATILSGVLVAGLIVGFYSLLIRILETEKIKDIIAYFQIFLVLATILLYQVTQIGVKEWLKKIGDVKPLWISFLPVAWFSAIPATFLEGFKIENLSLAFLGLLSVFVALVFPFKILSFKYLEYVTNTTYTSRRRVKLQKEKQKIQAKYKSIACVLLTTEEKLFFPFFWKMFKRDRELKTRMMPMLILPLLFMLIFYINGELKNPGAISINSFFGYFTFSFVSIMPAFYIGSFIIGMQSSKDWRAAYIYWVTPHNYYDYFMPQMIEFGFMCFVVPSILIINIFLAVVWGSLEFAIGNFGISILLSLFLVYLQSLFLPCAYPFSKSLEGQKGKIASMVGFTLIIVFSAGVFISVLAFYLTYKSLLGLAGVAAISILGPYLFKSIVRLKTGKKLREVATFEG